MQRNSLYRFTTLYRGYSMLAPWRFGWSVHAQSAGRWHGRGVGETQGLGGGRGDREAQKGRGSYPLAHSYVPSPVYYGGPCNVARLSVVEDMTPN